MCLYEMEEFGGRGGISVLHDFKKHGILFILHVLKYKVCIRAREFTILQFYFHRGLVQKKIAACVNIIPGITSV